MANFAFDGEVGARNAGSAGRSAPGMPVSAGWLQWVSAFAGMTFGQLFVHRGIGDMDTSLFGLLVGVVA